MTIIKSLLVGVATAVAAVLVYGLAMFAYVMLPLVGAWSSPTGSGGIGAVSVGSGPGFAVMLVAFVVGFYWKLRSEMRAKGRP